MRDAAHLIRLAGVFVAGTLLFLVVRQQLVPAGFGKYGHYRAGAVDDARTAPLRYAGRAACLDCHAEPAEVLRTQKHAVISCESCHGALGAHAADPVAVKVVRPDTALLCARCHEANTAKPKWFPQVVAKTHAEGQPCGACHQPHNPKL
jgi:hypothetical protein